MSAHLTIPLMQRERDDSGSSKAEVLSQLMTKRPRIERLPLVADSKRDHDIVRSMARAIEVPPRWSRDARTISTASKPPGNEQAVAP